MTKELNSQQKQQLVEQYVNISVDRMSTKDLELYVIDDMFHNLIDKDEIDLKNWIEDDELYDELVDNVTSKDNSNMETFIPTFHD